MASAIPPDLVKQVEQRTGCSIVAERPRGGGGASRQGAELNLRDAAGKEQRCYLAWDARAGDPSRLPYFDREAAILTALSGRFRAHGVRVARLIAAFRSHLALLSEFVVGDDRFTNALDKPALAADFAAQLAALHRLDARDPAFGALGNPDERHADRIRANITRWREVNLKSAADPIFQLALAWLGDNVPDYIGPAVVLHGDAGPGNFLYDGSKVAALVDWELTHLGDPAEDLAQIEVRSLIQPFAPMAQVLAAYAAAGAPPIDRERLKFHRLYFQLSFLVPAAALAAGGETQSGANGTSLLYGTMHRRVIVRSLAEQAGITLADPVLPDCTSGPDDRLFQTALDDLKRDIVPAASNQRAAAKGKELARLVKYWRRRASHGAVFDAAELAEIRAVLPDAPDQLAASRQALAQAVAADRIGFAAALQLCHNRMVRDTWILADAMGALATTWYEE